MRVLEDGTMKRILLTLVGMSAMAGLGTASAADLPRQAPLYKAPAYVAPVSNWTGFYAGLNGGGAWGTSNWTGLPSDFDVSGGLIGGTIGYNWQMNQVVFGLEGDLDWSGISGTTTAVPCTTSCETRNDWLGTARGRIGYAFDRFLPYVTGGAAFGNIKASPAGFGGVDETKVGWTVGGGVEVAIVGPWTAKVEYLYTDLGSTTCGAGSCAASTDVDFRSSLVRAGINYRF